MELILQITQQCSFACDYCYADTHNPTVMSLETARKAVEQFFPEKGTLTVGFFGGEPLLAFDRIKEITSLLQEKAQNSRKVKLSCTFTTNGNHMTEDVADWIKANGFELGVSLDGTAEMHNIHRRKPDGSPTHEKAVAALRMALQREIPVSPIMVVTPKNARFLNESVRFFIEDLHLTAFSISPDLSADWTKNAQTVITEQMQKVMEQVKACYLAGRSIKISAIDEKIHSRKLEGKPPKMRCRWGQGKVSVAADGAVFPCEIVGSSMPGNLRIGQVGQSLDEKHIAEMKRSLATPKPMCEDCPYIARCHFWCGCQRFLGGDKEFQTVPASLCFFQKLWCRSADKLTEDLLAAHCKAYYADYYVPAWLQRTIRSLRRKIRQKRFSK